MASNMQGRLDKIKQSIPKPMKQFVFIVDTTSELSPDEQIAKARLENPDRYTDVLIVTDANRD